ncbi:MAG: hypothetical protein ACE15F_24075 [bacterium]
MDSRELQVAGIVQLFEDRLAGQSWAELSRILEGAPGWRVELDRRWGNQPDWASFRRWENFLQSGHPGREDPEIQPGLRHSEIMSGYFHALEPKTIRRLFAEEYGIGENGPILLITGNNFITYGENDRTEKVEDFLKWCFASIRRKYRNRRKRGKKEKKTRKFKSAKQITDFPKSKSIYSVAEIMEYFSVRFRIDDFKIILAICGSEFFQFDKAA